MFRNKDGLIRTLALVGAAVTAAALALNGQLVEAGGVMAAALSSPPVRNEG